MRMTEQRRQIVRALVGYVHLATRDFYGLANVANDGEARALRRVLHDLAELGLVRRDRLIEERSPKERIPHWEYLYWLSPRGLAVAQEEGLDKARTGKAAEDKSLLMLPHEHAITAFHLALNRAAGAQVWWRQRDLRHTFVWRDATCTVSPDALFYSGGYYHFLEIERSHQGHYRERQSALMAKAEAYASYFASRMYKERWAGMEGFFVLVVMRTAARASWLAERLRAQSAGPIFRLSHEALCQGNPLGPVWLHATTANGERLLPIAA